MRDRVDQHLAGRQALAARLRYWILPSAVLLAFWWAYSDTLSHLVAVWEAEPDYAHGYLVLPLALILLWFRRGSRPTGPLAPSAWGLVLVGLSILVRIWGASIFTDAADGYSILLWVAGAIWTLAGWAWLRWAWPGVLFLVFMVPLPFRMETALRGPLQQVAAQMSAVGLQCLGQPAFARGTVIWMGDHQLAVEQECSGLRIFMGVLALAYFFVAANRREVWESTLLIFSTIPVALLANATRIVVSGLLFQLVSSATAQRFSHDFAGWLTIVFAGILFALLVWYLRRLVRVVESVEVRDLIRSRSEQTAAVAGPANR